MLNIPDANEARKLVETVIRVRKEVEDLITQAIADECVEATFLGELPEKICTELGEKHYNIIYSKDGSTHIKW